MKDQYFGVEVEMTGITREAAARALAEHFGTAPRHTDDYYDSWYVPDPEGKEWRVMSDGSIRKERKTASGYQETPNRNYSVELVSPKLTYAEMPKFQECVRRVRKAGAKVNSSCGIHVHVDAADHDRQSLKNLLSIMYSKEDLLFKALQVDEGRAARFCQKVREPMLEKARQLSAEETRDLTQLEDIWYEGNIRHHSALRLLPGYSGVAVLQLHPPRRAGKSLHRPVPGHVRPGHQPAQHGNAQDPQRQRAVHLPGVAGAPGAQRPGVQAHPGPPAGQPGG